MQRIYNVIKIAGNQLLFPLKSPENLRFWMISGGNRSLCHELC